MTGPGLPQRGPAASRGSAPQRRRPAGVAVDPARLAAWQTLRAVTEDDAYANLVLPKRLRQARLHGRDAAFATELTYGTLRGRGTYDAVIAACSDRRLSGIDPAVLDALRLGVHQLLAMRVPAHAAVDATVDLVRAEIGRGTAGFVNAVLRKVAADDLPDWLARIIPEGASEDTRLALTHSHPEWILRALRDSLAVAGRNRDELPELLAADNAPAELTLTALPGLVAPEELQRQTHGAAGRLSPYAVRVTGEPGGIAAVRSARARVQDEGSQVVALALADAALTGGAGSEGTAVPVDHGQWLDMCAGPGGKAALLSAVLRERRLAGELPPSARLIANEISEHRAELVRSSLAGVLAAATPGGPVAEVRVGDARDAEALRTALRPGPVTAGAAQGYDRILLDAPCTGLGALRRRPESRWRRTPADVGALAGLQRELLNAGLDLLRPGGVLAYVTCSPHPAETSMVVDDVLRSRRKASAATGSSPGPGVMPLAERLCPDRRLWPHVDGTDAMFVALLGTPADG